MDTLVALALGLLLFVALQQIFVADRILAAAGRQLPSKRAAADSAVDAQARPSDPRLPPGHPGGGVVHKLVRAKGEYARVDPANLEEPLRAAFIELRDQVLLIILHLIK